MRVIDRHRGTMEARKVGKWQPNCASCKRHGLESWPRTNPLMAALTLPSLLLVIGAMALSLILIAVVPTHAFGSIKVAVPGDSLSDSSSTYFPSALVHAESSSLLVCLCWAICAFAISGLHSAPVPDAHNFSWAQSSALSVHTPLSRFFALPPPFISPHPIKMPRERLRMVSRRDSSRGRATHQHSSTTLDPSEDASVYLATRSGRGKGRGQARGRACMHHAHPTARFRIPCSLANSSFIVSMTIEKCENAMGSGAIQHGVPAEQRLASQIATPRHVSGGMPTMHTEANVGPSEPARGESSSSAVHSSISMDSGQFGYRIVEEQLSTSNED